jgi:hypothetical protein
MEFIKDSVGLGRPVHGSCGIRVSLVASQTFSTPAPVKSASQIHHSTNREGLIVFWHKANGTVTATGCGVASNGQEPNTPINPAGLRFGWVCFTRSASAGADICFARGGGRYQRTLVQPHR